MAKLDFSDKVKEASQDITHMEEMLGKTLLQPFSGSNAGARKIMFSTHVEHVFPLIDAEKAIIETGYEIRFGDYSSSITRADADYQVAAKISKFSSNPHHHYWLILKNVNLDLSFALVRRVPLVRLVQQVLQEVHLVRQARQAQPFHILISSKQE